MVHGEKGSAVDGRKGKPMLSYGVVALLSVGVFAFGVVAGLFMAMARDKGMYDERSFLQIKASEQAEQIIRLVALSYGDSTHTGRMSLEWLAKQGKAI
jgi:hypothetical protein